MEDGESSGAIRSRNGGGGEASENLSVGATADTGATNGSENNETVLTTTETLAQSGIRTRSAWVDRYVYI